MLVILGARSYALPVEVVQEVLPLAATSPVPGAPEALIGVLDLRGQLVPLFDAAPTLGQAPTALDPRQQVVVLELATGGPQAILVDRAEGVRQAITTDAGNGLSLQGGICSGLVMVDGQPIPKLDPLRVLEAARGPDRSRSDGAQR